MLIYIQIRPLDWWKANETKFPILSQVARKYLQIPASSASSERFFSQGALINTKLRNRLNKSTFEKIISLKSQGVIKDEEYILKQEEIKQAKALISEEDNMIFIEPKA